MNFTLYVRGRNVGIMQKIPNSINFSFWIEFNALIIISNLIFNSDGIAFCTRYRKEFRLSITKFTCGKKYPYAFKRNIINNLSTYAKSENTE